jgi:hypothetical protein
MLLTNWTSVDVPNYTKNLLATWSVLSIILSVVGNTTVLIATIGHNAIKFDKVSVVLIENIAMADMGEALLVIVPTTWALLNKGGTVDHFFMENGFGKVLCYVVAHLQFLFPFASAFMLCALNISKLMCLMYPLRSHVRSRLTAYCLAGVAWTLYAIRLIAVKLAHEKVIYGHWEKGFRCGADITDRVSWPDVVFMAFFGGVLSVVLISSMSVTICYVSRVTGINKQAAVVNILLSSMFALSMGPMLVRVMWLAKSVPTDQLPFCYQLWLAGVFVSHIMSFANPFIYYISSASFKSFISCLCRRWVLALRMWITRCYGTDAEIEGLISDEELLN